MILTRITVEDDEAFVALQIIIRFGFEYRQNREVNMIYFQDFPIIIQYVSICGSLFSTQKKGKKKCYKN